jgi:hypothetical protein
LCEPPAERFGRDEVGERPHPVDLHDRQQLPVALLELGDARDVNLLELERLLRAYRLEDTPRRLAEMALGSVIEGDADYGYRPRVMVASETRWTARP